MTASAGTSAFGTFLFWNGAKVLELTSISGPSESRNTIDVTSHDSDDAYAEYIAGVAEGGEISLEGNLITTDSAGQVAFHTDLQAGTKRTGFIVLPMALGKAFTFTGMGSGFSGSYPYDDKASVSGTVKVSGKPTYLTTQSTGISALSGIEEIDTTALSLNEVVAAGTYAYTCTVDTDSSWVKLTVTAASHTIYVNGTAQTTTVQGGEIALGAAGTTTEITILVYETSKAPRVYTLSVTRPAA
jgi:predicted secreted protein